MNKYVVVLSNCYNDLEVLAENVPSNGLEEALRSLEQNGSIDAENAVDVRVLQETDVRVELAGLKIHNLPAATKPPSKKKGA